MAGKNGLLKTLVATVFISAGIGGLFKSCVDGYYDGKPGVVYYVNGKPIIERRFNTNEELDAYTNSEKGKAEARHYSELNDRERKKSH